MRQKNLDNLLQCLVTAHSTLSICSRCLECCSPEEEVLFGELSEDAARMIQKINKEFKS